MRKNINIIGVGRRMSGVGKNSGANYDFTPVSFTYEDQRTSGLKAATCNVNQADMPYGYAPSVGETVEAVIREDYKTGRVYIDAIL